MKIDNGVSFLNPLIICLPTARLKSVGLLNTWVISASLAKRAQICCSFLLLSYYVQHVKKRRAKKSSEKLPAGYFGSKIVSTHVR